MIAVATSHPALTALEELPMLATASLRSDTSNLAGQRAGALTRSWTVDPHTGALRARWSGEAALDEQRLGDGIGFAPEPAFIHEPGQLAEVQAAA